MIFAILGSFSFSIASFCGSTSLAASFLLFSALFFCYSSKASKSFTTDFFISGIIFHLVSFYWLPETLSRFGGFPYFISIILFILFTVISSLQFLLAGYLFSKLQKTVLADYLLALPFSWFILEFFTPRLFPWAFAHPSISIHQLALIASYTGESFVSFLIFLLAELVIFIFQCFRQPLKIKEHSPIVYIIATLIIFVCLSYKQNFSIKQQIENAEKIKVSLIQGNLSISEKGNINYLSANLMRYRELSAQAKNKGTELIIWPETVMTNWTPELIQDVRDTEYAPAPNLNLPIIYGTLSYRVRSAEEINKLSPEVRKSSDDWRYNKYNSAFALDENGKVQGRYHKKILMPFGEYLPFADIFPQIKSLSPHTGDFSVGKIDVPIKININNKVVKAGMLICYEDLLSSLSIDSVKHGANILINLTNDAWYGDTHAPYQHNLIASWKAIETGRVLLRATNTGYTAVISPRGDIIEGLENFKEGTLTQTVPLLTEETFFVKNRNLISYLAFLGLMIFAFLGKKKDVK